VGRDIATVLSNLKPDTALNLLRPARRGRHHPGHPGNPADSYSHSGVLASALAMQKDFAKVAMANAGVPVPEGMVVSRQDAAKSHPLPRPYVIKPIAEGSSVGVFIVTEAHEHPPQELTRPDWSYGERLLCERYIAGKELTCAVMGENPLGVIEIVPSVR
jgi:D-alanine-D-alanine ligase